MLALDLGDKNIISKSGLGRVNILINYKLTSLKNALDALSFNMYCSSVRL